MNQWIEWEIANDWRLMPWEEKFARILRLVFSDIMFFIYIALVLYFIGGMSIRTMCAVMFLYFLLWNSIRQNGRAFTYTNSLSSKPYYFNVRVNLTSMLEVLKINQTEYKIHPESTSSKFLEISIDPRDNSSILIFKMRAAILQSSFRNPLLIHRSTDNTYCKNLEIEIELDSIKFPYGNLEFPTFSWSPNFFLKRVVLADNGQNIDLRVGYGIGIAVKDECWEANQTNLPSSATVLDGNMGWKEIIFVFLPHAAFDLIDSKRLKEKEMHKIRNATKEALSSTGWKIGYWGNDEISPVGEASLINDGCNIAINLVE